MTRYPHRIRLRGPWECVPAGRTPLRMTLPCRWADGGLKDFRGRVRFRRRFGYPGRIDDFERVWLTIAGLSDRAAVSLNGAALGECADGGPCEFEITPLLQARNELVMDVEGTEQGGLWGEIALEVRCKAYLRDVRAWADAELHVVGRAVGEAERPLDLYVLLDNATAAYTTVAPAPEGTPFHIIAGKPSVEPATVRVDLVYGAVVWYTAETAVEFAAGG